MGKFILILGLLSLQGVCNALKCYECVGFDSLIGAESNLNNRACADGHFDADEVNVVNANNSVSGDDCFKFEGYMSDDYEYTVRGFAKYEDTIDVAVSNAITNLALSMVMKNDELALEKIDKLYETIGKNLVAGQDGIAARRGYRATKAAEYPYVSRCNEDLCNGSWRTVLSPFALFIFLLTFAITL